MTDSPFSGGGGTPVDPNAQAAPMPQAGIDLMNMLNKAAIRKYIIDQDGTKVTMEFATDGMVTITSGGNSVRYPFTKG
jgi:hypothetical protein